MDISVGLLLATRGGNVGLTAVGLTFVLIAVMVGMAREHHEREESRLSRIRRRRRWKRQALGMHDVSPESDEKRRELEETFE